MDTAIAIIIPAYKARFLERTLTSLKNQSYENFNLYIGDDNSPENLEPIVMRYKDDLTITYHRFEDNLGGVDLVAHWNRCLKMLRDEEWFIMFSDDDLMEEKCLALLANTIQHTSAKVLRYDFDIIDGDDNIIRSTVEYPKEISGINFIHQLYSEKIDARMPEFVFNRKHFINMGGFINFPLAMRSDNATVFLCAFDNTIETIKGAKIQWRDSGINVSSGSTSIHKNKLHFQALLQFCDWIYEQIHVRNIKSPFSKFFLADILVKEAWYVGRYLGVTITITNLYSSRVIRDTFYYTPISLIKYLSKKILVKFLK